ncbi:MAG: Ig-like domain-containing protein [Burkholderiales bacterium]|nr:Ig-like domain-containing protein [Burkholderiales bacterium]
MTGGFVRWAALSATALAALAACGGGGGGGDSGAPTNQAPSVTIDSPAANASFAAGEPIRIAATAADSDGTVTRVEFYNGTTKIGEDATAPYELVWTDAPTGALSITAVAFDSGGNGGVQSAVSSSRPLTVTTAPAPAPTPSPPPAPTPNQPPTVSITSPANNFKPNAPAAVTIVANAADADGGIAKVEFFRIDAANPVFDASTKLGEDSTSPYEFSWAGVGAGVYTLAARAIDNQAAVATSASVQVIVNALPTVNLTAPLAGASIQLGSTVTLRAVAADADGSVSKVEFFLAGSATPLGQGTRVGTTSEYTFAWTASALGDYAFIARATDNDGATQSTASVAVNVPANTAPTIALEAPTAGTNAPTTLALAATAADSDGTVASVEFFNGATSLGLGTFDGASGKYRLTVPIGATQHGTYTVTARATDNRGGTSTTASRSVTIAANVPPAVALSSAAAATLPVNATTGSVALAATATDTDGIARVEFFSGAAKVGEATTAPFQVTWAGVAEGSYPITARATDTVGSTTTTPAQTLVVTPNVEGMWANLNAAQKAGHTLTPNRPVEAGGVDAVEVMTVVGVTTVIPKFSAAMAQAALSLARAIPGSTTAGFVQGPCTSGTIQVYQNGADRGVNLDNCVIGGFTFYGGGGVAPYVQYDTTASTTAVPPATQPVHPNPNCVLETAPVRRWRCLIGSGVDWIPLGTNGFRLILQGVQVTGNGALDAGGKDYPRNAFGYTRVECTGSGAAQTCMTLQDVSFFWGHDLAWTDYTTGPLVFPASNYATDDTYRLNGTHRSHYCSPDFTQPDQGRNICLANPPVARHVKFENMTPTSGRAIVYGGNGWSVVTRMPRPGTDTNPANEYLQVRRTLVQAVTAGGTTYPVGTGPLETYRCAVGTTSGDWSCTFVTSTP